MWAVRSVRDVRAAPSYHFAALRRGDWKIVAAKGDPWELYDLRTDRAEMNNLASDNPDLTKELAAEWEAETSAIRELVNSIEQ